MFGYITANTEVLSDSEKERYTAAYCGLCKALGEKHGQLSRLSLNYDMTFLVLMLASLYEPEEQKGELRCLYRRANKQSFIRNIYTDYAADITTALAYFKCLDDWKDERKLSRKGYGAILKKEYEAAKSRYPRQCNAIEASINEISLIEKENTFPDAGAESFGRAMGEIFAVWDKDVWSPSLRAFGDYLGRFIYLMDAAIDYYDDIKKGSYNPFTFAKNGVEGAEQALTLLIGKAAEIFERLPLVRDEQILRSVIYSGVWIQYYKKYKTQDKTQTADKL